MRFSYMNNGIPVDAEFSDSFINETALPLLRRWTEMAKERQGRVVIFLAAPPAAGKSTLSAFLGWLSERTEGIAPVTVCGMDGFHRYQDYLLTHTMPRDGKEVRMVDYKGAPETFDLDALRERLELLKSGADCPWPVYDRTTHNPVEGLLTVTGRIALVEGNYLLLNWLGWRDLKQLADGTVFLSADREILRQRLIERKMQTGKSLREAVDFVERSDLYNADTVLRDSTGADIVIEERDIGCEK